MLPGNGPCFDGPEVEKDSSGDLKLRQIAGLIPWEYDPIVAVDLRASDAIHSDGTFEISCVFQLHPARLTFTRYALTLLYRLQQRSGLTPATTIQVIPVIDHAEAMETSWAEGGNSYADLHYDDGLRIEYDNVLDESRRDILFVVIGALIALGAAMALESLRPLAEEWADRQA